MPMDKVLPSSAYDEELACDACGEVLLYGHGDFNCTYTLCKACLEELKAKEGS